MDFNLNFGKGKELTAKFSMKALRMIETRGMNYLKELSVPVRGPMPAGWFLNQMNQAGVFLIVVEEALKAGGNAVGGKGGLDVEGLLESYVENVGDISDLTDEIVTAFNQTTAPRQAAKRAAEKAEAEAEAKADEGGEAKTAPKTAPKLKESAD